MTTFRELRDELIGLFRRGVDAPVDDPSFGELALRVFEHQFRSDPVYADFCRGRGVTPESATDWREVPAVPTRAFKSLRFISAPTDVPEAVFRTSGTSRGPGERGEHHVPSLELYRASLLPNFRAHLLPDGARLPLISLIPAPERAPDSSLSHMMGVVERELCAPGGGWFVEPDRGIREEPLHDALRALEADGRPALIAGTAFSFVHWMDAADRDGRRYELPEGSRIMETGGFKGRSRELGREELYGGLEARLGVPAARIVNEYGMTELLSQFYEPHLRESPHGTDAGADGGRGPARRHVGPPWVRTRILDPVTLDEVEPGRRGLLCHHDLANAGSVMAVLTEDLGVAAGDGFRVLGRAGDAEPRGCSLAMDELLSGIDRG